MAKLNMKAAQKWSIPPTKIATKIASPASPWPPSRDDRHQSASAQFVQHHGNFPRLDAPLDAGCSIIWTKSSAFSFCPARFTEVTSEFHQ
jgi:hypothetical protein